MKIACPKCKKSKDLILEQPTWSNERGFNKIVIDANCINCNIDFMIDCKIEPIRIRDIEENKPHPY